MCEQAGLRRTSWWKDNNNSEQLMAQYFNNDWFEKELVNRMLNQ